jgi:Zn-dependent M28 family amino/carboxypeptidase
VSPQGRGPTASVTTDRLKAIFDEVDGARITQLMRELSGGHPRAGDNIEAVLRGPSADSIIIIVHYDSISPIGRETSNPGADDDMSGMSIQLETARLLVAHRAELTRTVRFVVSDE